MSGGRLFSTIGLVVSIAFALPASALADETVLEAESMTWQAGSGKAFGPAAAGYTKQDASNPSVAGYWLWTNQPGLASVATTKPLSAIRLRLRSEQTGSLCQGSPQVVVKDGSTTLLTATITPATTYSDRVVDFGAPLSTTTVPAGSHDFKVALTNDQDSPTFPCDRNLWVDKLTLVSSQVFPDDSWRNAPLADNAPLTADQSLVSELVHQLTTSNGTKNTWVNTDDYSVPVYTVPASQARVAVTLDPRPGLAGYKGDDVAAFNREFASVPLPSDAKSAGPTDGTSDGEWWGNDQVGYHWIGTQVPWADRELAVYQPSTDTLWELYHLVKYNGQWVATDGGKITNVSANTGYDNPRFPSGKLHGVAATRIPVLATLQRIRELQTDHVIKHPVSIHVPHVPGVFPNGPFSFPALASDGDWNESNYSWDGTPGIPEGTWFRLPRSFDVTSLAGHPYAQMVAKAAQDYGMIVTDKDCWPSKLGHDANGQPVKCTSAVTTIAEDWTPTGSNPYPSIFGQDNQETAMDFFPWDQLQVVAPPQ